MLQREFFAFEPDIKHGPTNYIAVSSLISVKHSWPIYAIKVRGGVEYSSTHSRTRHWKVRFQHQVPASVPPGKNTVTHRIGSWVGPRDGIKVFKVRNTSDMSGIRTVVRPSRTLVATPNALHLLTSWVDAESRNIFQTRSISVNILSWPTFSTSFCCRWRDFQTHTECWSQITPHFTRERSPILLSG
jgi:hypothetical protein